MGPSRLWIALTLAGLVCLASGRYAHGSLGPRREFRSDSPQNKTFQAIGPPQQTIDRRSPPGTDPGVCSGNVPGQGNFSPATAVCGNNAGFIAEHRDGSFGLVNTNDRNPGLAVRLDVRYDF